jgi:hypothetical protein
MASRVEHYSGKLSGTMNSWTRSKVEQLSGDFLVGDISFGPQLKFYLSEFGINAN